MRPQGSPAELEQRRLRAIELLQRDLPVHVVAGRLGVARRSVRRWKRAHRRQGRAGLRARPASGRPPKLSLAQRHRLARLVMAGPEAAGYRTGLWTCRRIVDLIRRQFKVVYHPDHVGRLLRACGFSPQRPQPRAKERDDRRVRDWVLRDWRRVKKLRRLGAHLICLDETGFLMMPVLRRTWAPCGLTPTLSVRTRSHEKVSGIGALIVSPRRRQLTLALALHPRRNIRSPQVVRFLRHLGRHVRGPFILVWDRGRSHKHELVQSWLDAHPRCHIVWFPPYAPDLNPVELLWSYLKYGRLANLAPDTVDDIQSNVRRERRRLTRHPQLLRSFFRHSALPFRV